MSCTFTFDILLNVFSDGQLDGSLTDLGQIRARKSFGDFSHITHVHGFSHWSFPQIGFQNGTSGGFIGQRDIDQLVKTSRTQNSRINDVRSKKRNNFSFNLTGNCHYILKKNMKNSLKSLNSSKILRFTKTSNKGKFTKIG